MNVQEILAQIDHAITEIDLELHEWQEGLDMMSFIYVDASFELWTNDDPPVIITKDALRNAAGKELRVMHHVNGAWTKVGTAVVNEDGNVTAQVDKHIPGITDQVLAHFSIDKDGDWKKHVSLNPPFESLNKPLTIRGLEEAIYTEEKRREYRKHVFEPFDKDDTDKWMDRVENHSFFKEQ